MLGRQTQHCRANEYGPTHVQKVLESFYRPSVWWVSLDGTMELCSWHGALYITVRLVRSPIAHRDTPIRQYNGTMQIHSNTNSIIRLISLLMKSNGWTNRCHYSICKLNSRVVRVVRLVWRCSLMPKNMFFFFEFICIIFSQPSPTSIKIKQTQIETGMSDLSQILNFSK